jgi:hypothetical protein
VKQKLPPTHCSLTDRALNSYPNIGNPIAAPHRRIFSLDHVYSVWTTPIPLGCRIFQLVSRLVQLRQAIGGKEQGLDSEIAFPPEVSREAQANSVFLHFVPLSRISTTETTMTSLEKKPPHPKI